MADDKTIRTALILSAVDKMSRIVNESVSKSIGSLNKFKAASDKMGGKAGFGSLAATGGIIYGAKMAIDAYEKIEDAQTQLENTYMQAGGKMDPMFKKIETYSNSIAGNFKGGKAEIMSMTTALIQSGVKASDVIAGVGKSTAMFADVMGVGYGEAAEQVGRIGQSFQLSGKDLSSFMDVMQRTKNMGIHNFEEIANAMKQSKISLSGQGGLENARSAAAIIATIAPAMGGPEKAGSAFSMAMQKAMDITKISAANAELRKFGKSLTFTDKTGNFLGMGNMVAQLGQLKTLPDTAKTQILNKIFGMGGRGGGAAARAMMNMGGAGFNEAIAKMMGQANLVTRFSNIQKKAGYQTQATWQKAKDTMATIGAALMPTFNDLITQVRRIIDNFQKFFDKNKALGKIIKDVTIGLVAFKVAMIVTSAIAGGLAQVMNAVKIAFAAGRAIVAFTTGAFNAYNISMVAFKIAAAIGTAVQWLFNASLFGCPIVWIIAGIIAVIAAVWLLVKYWKPITAFFGKVWEGIKNIFSKSWEWIKGIFVKFWEFLKGWGKLILIPFAPFLLVPLLIIQNWSKITAFFSGLWAGITGIFNKVITWIENIAVKFYNAGANIVTAIWHGIVSMAMKPVEAITNIVKKIRNFLPFSPAKEGPLSTLHKVRIVETIVQNMKPGPVIKAMKSITGAMTGSSFNVSRSGGSQVVYSPVINLYGSATAKDKDDFVKMIKTHQSDLMRLINENNSRNDRLKY